MVYKKLYRWALLTVITFAAAGCGELARVRKSNDDALKYDYAKKYYNLKKYKQASELLTDVVGAYDGSEEGARALYMMAESELRLKHYAIATELFIRYYNSYPKGEMVEQSRYYAGYALYKDMPDARLDQDVTLNAIRELQLFNELYPQNKRRNEVKEMLFALQDNLAYKELLSARLYYDLGMYLGNNYHSAIVTANNALKAYPYNKHREEFYILLLRATYKEAVNSVEEKLQTRYRDVADRYFVYANEFPEGKHIKEAQKLYEKVQGLISDDV